jgi:hypothetical protein
LCVGHSDDLDVLGTRSVDAQACHAKQLRHLNGRLCMLRRLRKHIGLVVFAQRWEQRCLLLLPLVVGR